MQLSFTTYFNLLFSKKEIAQIRGDSRLRRAGKESQILNLQLSSPRFRTRHSRRHHSDTRREGGARAGIPAYGCIIRPRTVLITADEKGGAHQCTARYKKEAGGSRTHRAPPRRG